MRLGKNNNKEQRYQLKDFSNEALLEEYVIKGNAFAFLALARRYEHRLLGFFKTANISYNDSVDLIQEVYIGLLKSKSFKECSIENYECFLFRIARNKKLDFYKQKKKIEKKLDFQSPQMLRNIKELIVENESHEDSILTKEGRFVLLNEAIEQLNGKQAEAIRLQLEGLSYEEIAKQMNTQATNVGSLINRAKTKMKKWIK